MCLLKNPDLFNPGTYPMKPLVLWLPSQKGFVADWPHLQMDVPFGFSTVVPSGKVTIHGPATLAGPLVIMVTLFPSGVVDRTDMSVCCFCDFNEMAPVGHALTASSIWDRTAPSSWIHGLSRGLNTDGNVWKQTAA